MHISEWNNSPTDKPQVLQNAKGRPFYPDEESEEEATPEPRRESWIQQVGVWVKGVRCLTCVKFLYFHVRHDVKHCRWRGGQVPSPQPS